LLLLEIATLLSLWLEVSVCSSTSKEDRVESEDVAHSLGDSSSDEECDQD
jgi:ABC-type Fe3+-citrate transport system substrate-binding protein